MLRKLILALPLALMATGVADAQQPVAHAQTLPNFSKIGGSVRVQVHVVFFIAGPVNDSAASLKAQEGARRALYESAGRECDLLRSVIASECQIESINVGVQRSFGGQQGEGFNASGNFGFRVTLK
jgi:hypothetical protein